MLTFRKIGGTSIEEMLYPNFRKVRFSDSGAMKTVTYHIRHAWKTTPPPLTAPDSTYGKDDIPKFMQSNQNLTEEQRKEAETDDRQINTAWREQVYWMYNHVFADVMRFLVDVGPGMGHPHFPCHETFGISLEEGRVGKVMKWDHHVLIIPAFLAEGVKIKAMRVVEEDEGGKNVEEEAKEEEKEEKEKKTEVKVEEKTDDEGPKEEDAVAKLGENENTAEEGSEEEEAKDDNIYDTFSKDTLWDIWWLKKNTEIKFVVEGDVEDCKDGLAAVMVLGNLCEASDRENVSESEEDEEEQEEEEENDEVEELREELSNFKTMAEEERKETEDLKKE